MSTHSASISTTGTGRTAGGRVLRRIAVAGLAFAAVAGVSGVSDAAEASTVRPVGRITAPAPKPAEKKLWEYDCVAIHGANAGYHALQTCIENAKDLCNIVDEGTFKHSSYGKVSCHK